MKTSTRKLLLCWFTVYATVFSFTKAKNCTVENAVVSSTTMTLDNKNCTTFSSKPCDRSLNVTELRLSYNQIRELKSRMFSCLHKLKKLYIDNNLISSVRRGAFPILTALKTLDLSNNRITEIGEDAFDGLDTLSELDLQNNGITNIAPGAFDSLFSLNLLQLRNNNLVELPEFRVQARLSILEISFNPLRRLDAKILGKYTRLKNLYLINTHIELLPDRVFRNNSGLRLLSLQDSRLNKIEPKAFEGTQLQTLHLVRTKITELPGEGLERLTQLTIKGVKDLWTIPIVKFKHLENASVEYPFHCCLIHAEVSGYRGEVGTQQSVTGNLPTVPTCSKPVNPVTEPSPHSSTTPYRFNIQKADSNSAEKIHTLPACIPHNENVVTAPSKVPLNCTPGEDAFNPCGDLLGSLALRICSWFVLVFALLGNSLKLLVLLISRRKMPIYKILMCNLALANLCMGVFLCMLASADLHSLGAYQNFAIAWQYRNGCNIAGFLSIFSTELAVFVLTIITVERYFMIVYPLNQDKHLNTNQIVVLVAIGWLFSLTMAALPLLNISSYKKVAICLPFDVETPASQAYVTFLLATNGLAFFFVLFCYGRMYCSLGGSRGGSSVPRVEGRVAKRMAMLVLTNFACWFPIALVSLIAIYGTALVGVPAAKFFLVFVYPINSFTNPYLYAIGTKHFQLDALEILRGLGMCSATIDKLSSRLRDQLDAVPNSSRAHTGSRISLSSVRSPFQSPGMARTQGDRFSFSSRGKSNINNNASCSDDGSRVSRSSKKSCSPCHLLTIPLIRSKKYEMSRNNSADSTGSYNPGNTRGTECSSSSNSLEVETVTARRLSARDVVLAGSPPNTAGLTANGTKNVRIQQDCGNGVGENAVDKQRKTTTNTSFQVPTVMVTSC